MSRLEGLVVGGGGATVHEPGTANVGQKLAFLTTFEAASPLAATYILLNTQGRGTQGAGVYGAFPGHPGLPTNGV
jgi:hypothetical protein